MTATRLPPGVGGYFQWQKALWDNAHLRGRYVTDPKSRFDLRSVAQVIALHGENGRGIFVSAATIGRIVGCSERHAKTLRRDLENLGWLVRTGAKAGRTKRSDAWDIALPDGRAESSSPVPPHAYTRVAAEDSAQPSAPVAVPPPPLPDTPPAKEPEPAYYDDAAVFGASGADPWDEDDEYADAGGTPVRAWGGGRRAWDRG